MFLFAKRYVSMVILCHGMFVLTYSQWSTSTKPESALFVTPGYYKSMMVLEDGSSIICGGLSSSIYAQKLDARGYKVGESPIIIMNTVGASSNGIGNPINDGLDGFYIIWHDLRDGESGPWGPSNSALYMQHVDKNGNILWGINGKQLAPITGGFKNAYGACDGAGGIIWYLDENDFLRTNATKKAKTWLVAFSQDGNKKWEREIDSSTISYHLYASPPIILGNRLRITTLNGFRFFDPFTGSEQVFPSFNPLGKIIIDGDSTGFSIVQNNDEVDDSGVWITKVFTITKFNINWDSLWSYPVKFKIKAITKLIPDKSQANNIGLIQTDQLGGVFYSFWFDDPNGESGYTVRWINEKGVRFTNNEIKIRTKPGLFFCFNGKGQYGITNFSTIAQKIDTSGLKLWSYDDTLKIDMTNSYTPIYANDNNGGAISAFWTLAGGIYAHHLGRVGKMGVISKVKNNLMMPSDVGISQNYPNPFNSSTSIKYLLPKQTNVSVKIYSILGKEIKTLINQEQEAGEYRSSWNGTDDLGREVSSGIYLLRFQTNNYSSTKKLVFIK